MASTTAYRNNAQILHNNDDSLTPYSTPRFRPTSRRNPSFSSLLSSPCSNNSSSRSSLLSFDDPFESPVFSPRTPLNFSGIPFSWEQTPGIPKNEIVSNKKQSSIQSLSFLPLPPAAAAGGNNNSLRKNSKGESKDPFFAALIECSKDIDQNSAAASAGIEKIYKTSKFSKRLTATMSCKSSISSVVSESMIFLPARSRQYQHLAKRRSI